MKHDKRILNILLPLALVLAAGLLAIAPITAHAAGEIGIWAGLPAFAVNTASPTLVGFGGKQWAVIGCNGTGVASTNGTLTLLLANGSSYGASAFWETSPYNNAYSGSNLRIAMDTAYGGLPAKEQALVVVRDLMGGSTNWGQPGYDDDNIAGANVTGANFWPLSVNEAYAVNYAVRTIEEWWWLRTPGIDELHAAFVYYSGLVPLHGRDVNKEIGAVRPALRLNLASVLFASDASGAGAKSSAAPGSGLMPAQPAGANVKFTVLDPSLVLDSVTATGRSGATVSLNYTGATAGKTLSAVVLRSGGAVKYYGKLAASTSTSGSASVTLPPDFAAGDTVQIFVEEAGGDNSTDFASAYKQLAIPFTTSAKGIFGTNARWYGEWWHYVLFFIGFGFIWMWF